MNAFVFDVLGLQNIEENNNAKLDQTLQVLIELRNQARKAKNFELSDQIRDKLLAARHRTERRKRRNFLRFELKKNQIFIIYPFCVLNAERVFCF